MNERPLLMLLQLTPTITMTTGLSFSSEGVQTLFFNEAARRGQKNFGLEMRLGESDCLEVTGCICHIAHRLHGHEMS